MSSTEPKPRPIKLEAHVLAYLGDFMNIFEESIRRQALREIHTLPKPSTTGTQKPREPPPSSRWYTASAHSPSGTYIVSEL